MIPESLQHVVRSDESLAPLVWLGIGGPAHFFAEPVDLDQVAAIVVWAAENDLPVRLLGSGSNVLVRESGFDGVVISLAAAATSGLSINDNRLTAGAGAQLSHAVVKAVGAGLGGLEHLVGIPGTVGAAVVGNVSSGGRDISPVVKAIRVVESDGTIREISQEDIGFTYRKTSLTGSMIVEVDFELDPGDSAALTKRLQKLWISRNSSRPADIDRIAMPFIDPDTISARELIQNVGLTGIREGDVSLDNAQPHYLIAHQGATSDQCLKLIDRVREQVLLQTGIDLQLNLQIW
ncbi:UDP-N-acetylmuramate dehydrogenase [Roseiconus lacunae]|uniref:UDP-N-acetylenolpyruvoylglucosamine reductase n=1 Tax=Roseiconus lacunae TaxID=2605694 RepID=A0ABT7PG60_9BACT|nr:FAD-binding protein [Roseiconus lacunae]MCD0460486.1 FAD-binding protein [Roseiconus lacunae]MDM4015467.1 FAD-binding protein [Roseiconus lacunae]WRQ52855.1 FAD-binding protein [Stieleria sp. HD01]